MFSKIKDKRVLAGIVGATAIFGAAASRFSGRDDNYLHTEGLRHGWYGKTRNSRSDFGSGFKSQTYSYRQAEERLDSNKINPSMLYGIGTLGVSGGLYAWNPKTNIDINSLKYLGVENPSSFFGRKKANLSDILYSGAKRLEASAKGT